MLLSDVAIKRHLKKGSIVIDPFVPQRLNNASYDLSLGPWVARYKKGLQEPLRPDLDADLFDLIDYTSEGGFELAPGERVLGHTREAVGGTVVDEVAVNSSLHATSTAQRVGISVCLDAGWGDVGFMHPYTLELNNHSPYRIFLPVGVVICQITFHEVEPPSRLYSEQGSYKGYGEWHPHLMLPKKLKTTESPASESVRHD